MGLFKKEEKKQELPELPELPPLPELPDMPNMPERKEEQKPQRNILPSFPSSSLGEKISQNAIKTAIVPPPKTIDAQTETDFDDFQPIVPSAKMKTQELDDFQPSRFESERDFSPQEFIRQAPETKERRFEPSRIEPAREKTFEMPKPRPRFEEKKPIFIRIDKYEKALENFETIKSEVKQMSEILREIKESRAKEETELSEWEKQVSELKEKMAFIGTQLFEKLD